MDQTLLLRSLFEDEYVRRREYLILYKRIQWSIDFLEYALYESTLPTYQFLLQYNITHNF